MGTERHETARTPSVDDRLDCDIVMAGGVTSGIVYPGAAAKIAERYTFRSIGGTSVGAAMAAATAAAEYGRRTGANPDAFAELAALPATLGRKGDGGPSLLLRLFTPDPETKPLLALVTPIFSGGGVGNVLSGVFWASVAAWPAAIAVLLGAGLAAAALHAGWAGSAVFAIAALAALVLIACLLAASLSRAALAVIVAVDAVGAILLAQLASVDLLVLGKTIALVLAALTLFVAIWAAAVVAMLAWRWIPNWKANCFGICTGYRRDARTDGDMESLTGWMHGVIQRAAGRTANAAPLTFGDLWTCRPEGAEPSPIDHAAERIIHLAMTTSDISRNRTAEVPFLDFPTGLYVEVETLKRFFPKTVVDWIVETARPIDDDIDAREGVVRLPRPEHLPILFGARLSLSFPFLLSAVPLMTPDFALRRRKGKATLRRVWFSDGGLASNFPVHFFDSPLPSRPTFCLNLIDYEADIPGDDPGQAAEKRVARSPARAGRAAHPAQAGAADPPPRDDVWDFVTMTKGNRLPHASFVDLDDKDAGLLSFAATLVNTARHWSDNQLWLAPGVRERVVNIGLMKGEGGLNLDMPQSMVDDLDLRGRAAGRLIAARFDPRETIDPKTGEPSENRFPNHRWVRYRSFMAALEHVSRRFAASWRGSDEEALRRGDGWTIDDMIEGKADQLIGYECPASARPFFRRHTAAFERYGLDMAADTVADGRATFDRPAAMAAEKAGTDEGAAPLPVMRMRLRPALGHDPQERAAPLPPGISS